MIFLTAAARIHCRAATQSSLRQHDTHTPGACRHNNTPVVIVYCKHTPDILVLSLDVHRQNIVNRIPANTSGQSETRRLQYFCQILHTQVTCQ